ncbi:MAG: alpha/beta hydrolase [Clostridia bacterium]|nr:alpha/beta hydrolase [Clostridia bacterium]
MNPVLRWVTKQFEKGAVSGQGFHAHTPDTPWDIDVSMDVPYQNHKDVPLAMDIYRPKDCGGNPLPVIIMVHGGGLLVGSRKMSRPVCEGLARSGCLVIAPQYRLLSETDAFGAIADLCAGLRTVEHIAPQYGGDPERIYVIGESAGAFLAVYACAMAASKPLCEAMSFCSANTPVKGLACLSGMFYTAKKDLIGRVYLKDLYGERRKDARLMQYMNPEHKEVIDNLPPVIMTTSAADFLKHYTLAYAQALEKAGHPFKLLDYGAGKQLIHAFPALNPFIPESVDAMSRILHWFSMQSP